MSKTIVVGMLLGLLGGFLIGSVHAHDKGQMEDHDPVVREWYRTLMMPDAPSVSCCGEADAYWCDTWYVRDGATYCKITDDRPDAPLKRPHIPMGTEFEIPNHKLKWSDGNPTGHAVLFANPAGFVFCFVQNGGY